VLPGASKAHPSATAEPIAAASRDEALPDACRVYNPFASFALIWALTSMVHQLAFSFWLVTWQGWLLNLGIIAVVFNPRCVVCFSCLLGGALLKFYHDLPFVPNHLYFEGLLHVTMVLGLAGALATWKGPRPAASRVLADLAVRFRVFLIGAAAMVLVSLVWPGNVIIATACGVIMVTGYRRALFGRKAIADVGTHFFHQVAPVARVAVVLVYWWAAVQKLNWDYLNPEVSAAAVLHKDIAAWFPFLPIPTGTWALYAAIWGSLLFEFGIPVLLVIPRTRFAGFVAAVGFHLWLSLHPHGGVYSFSALIFGALYFFLPRTAAIELQSLGGRFCRWLGRGDEELGTRRASRGAVGVYFAGLVAQATLYLTFGENRNVFNYANGIGFSLWFVLGLCLGAGYLASFMKTRDRLLKWPNHLVATPAWIGVLLVMWNGLNPWIGLKTQNAFSMFSNLRSEADGNHLFLKRLDIFPYQADMVELVESEPDILAVPEHPRSVRYYANPGRIFPRFELRRLLSETEGDVRVTYRQDGVLHEATRTNGVACPAELFEPHPWYLYKSLWFRRQVALTGPMHCTQ
jgi:hypothetical protein